MTAQGSIHLSFHANINHSESLFDLGSVFFVELLPLQATLVRILIRMSRVYETVAWKDHTN